MKAEKITVCHKNNILEPNTDSRVLNCNVAGVRRGLFAVTLLANWGLSKALTDKEIGQRVVNVGGEVMVFGVGLAVFGCIFCAIAGTINDLCRYKDEKNNEEGIQLLNTPNTDISVNNEDDVSLGQKDKKKCDFWVSAMLTTIFTGLTLLLIGFFTIIFGSFYCFEKDLKF